MNKRYTLHNLSEEDLEQLYTSITIEKLYNRTAETTEIINVDSIDGDTFLDGTPKYKVEISSKDSNLLNRFGHKK